MKLVFVGVLSLSVSVALGQGAFAIRNNDRVMFYGDSITSTSKYTNFVETFILTRYPKLKVTYFNAGVAGDTVYGGKFGTINQRLTRDFFSFRPNVFTIMLGMNDGNRRPFDEVVFDAYTSGYEKIVADIKKRIPLSRGWLIQPSPYDDYTRPPNVLGGYNSVLIKFGRFNAELAERNGYGTVDFNQPIVDLLKKGQLTDQSLSQQLIPDRIHPGLGAHVVMAWTLLQGWGATGMISTSNIAAASGQTSGLNVKFRSVKTSTTSAAWDSLEGSLPFPFDRSEPTVDFALRVTNLDRAMNVQTVKVSGLRAGQYRLKIDGLEIGKWTASDLNLGVNIGNLITPMADQADTVAKMTFERNVIQNTWWRDIKIRYEGLPGEGLPGAITGIQKLENDYLLLQRQAAQPKWHRFEVIKA
jgi:lysophospholipase L1-like esterase